MPDLINVLLNATISAITSGGNRIIQVGGSVPLVIHLPTGSSVDGVTATVSDAEVTSSLLTGLTVPSSYAAPVAGDTLLAAIAQLTFNASNAAIIAKVLTGFSSGAGTVAATDTILQAFNKLDGNVAAKLATASFTDAAVTGKLLTGFVSGAGTVAAGDTILQAIDKLDGNVGAIKHVAINAQVASYELVLTDDGKLVTVSNGSANNLTIPLNATVAFPIGTQILIQQLGAGQTTIVATGGVTTQATPGLKISAQYGVASLIKVDTDTWIVSGALSA